MKCLNCGAEIFNEKSQCPYCKIDITTSIKSRKKEDIELSSNKVSIDKFFDIPINDDFYKYTVYELERYYDSLEKEYNSIGFQLSEEERENIKDFIDNVCEKLQSCYPFRKEIDGSKVLKDKSFDSNYDLILFLLDSCKPSQIHAAAFKLRSLCERSLRDSYNFQYIDSGQTHKFKDSYFKMFKEITNNNTLDASLLCKYHTMLNLFVHESQKNDKEIAEHFQNEDKIVSFLKNVLEMHKKYNLL